MCVLICFGRRLAQVTVKEMEARERDEDDEDEYEGDPLPEEWHFVCDKWLTPQKKESLHQKVDASKEASNQPISYRFRMFVNRGLREGHVVLGVFTCSPHSTFNRKQRMTCALLFLCTMMLANIMFHGREPQSDDVGNIWGVMVPLATIKIGVFCALLTVPINILIVVLFNGAGPRPVKIDAKDDKEEETGTAISNAENDQQVAPAATPYYQNLTSPKRQNISFSPVDNRRTSPSTKRLSTTGNRPESRLGQSGRPSMSLNRNRRVSSIGGGRRESAYSGERRGTRMFSMFGMEDEQVIINRNPVSDAYIYILTKIVNLGPLSATLSFLIFYPPEVVSRYRDPQLPVGETYPYSFN